EVTVEALTRLSRAPCELLYSMLTFDLARICRGERATQLNIRQAITRSRNRRASRVVDPIVGGRTARIAIAIVPRRIVGQQSPLGSEVHTAGRVQDDKNVWLHRVGRLHHEDLGVVTDR